MIMTRCESYDPDNVFKRFKLLEFPTSFVGLSSVLILDVEIDITGSTYLKTMYHGDLMKFEDARELSAAHRAFLISQNNNHSIEITFKPINECIARVRKLRMFENRFVFDLRLIKVDGFQCCYDEYHSEVGRYYVSGKYEYCKVGHTPDLVNFGKVAMKSKVSRAIRFRNDSSIAARINYFKVTDFEVTPQKFVIPPNSSKRLVITFKPNSFKTATSLIFHIRNPHDNFVEPTSTISPLSDTNYLPYYVTVQADVFYNKKVKEIHVESLHTIYEPRPWNTYLDKQLTVHNERKELANQFLIFAKSRHVKKVREKTCTGTLRCYSDVSEIKDPRKTGLNFCNVYPTKAKASDLFEIQFSPLILDFGKVGVDTYGEKKLGLHNKTVYNVVITFLENKSILYTENKLANFTVKLNSKTSITITLLCFGLTTGDYKGTFAYVVDRKFLRRHVYTLQVSYPLLHIPETTLKFGMVTNESFITSIPIKIYNNFNVPVDYQWTEICQEAPFEIIPCSGTVPKHGCRICDLTYISKITKTKTHELECISKGELPTLIPLEVHVITRKLSVKFLQSIVLFKDIPINLLSTETVKLENSSREIAQFYVMEPIIPGITVEPMNGILRPKTVITFVITVKISCVLEFNFDLYVKINNKETIGIALNGNTIEPKLNISPKNIYMPRIPCGMITYVPVNIQNTGTIKTEIEVVDTGDENIFNIYETNGNEKQRIHKFTIEGGQNKIVFIKVCDVFRREYDMFVPFKINGLLGPPNQDTNSTELNYYTQKYERLYDSNIKAKVKSVNKDISFCRISGVITVPWISISMEKFEIDYVPNGNNTIKFTMTNISKYYLPVCILTSKLAPHFSLDLKTEDSQSIITDNNMKFELDRGMQAEFCLKFHPKGVGNYVGVAIFYLDKASTIPYFNLTFTGRRDNPQMSANIRRIIFPPCYVGTELNQTIKLKYHDASELNSFTCSSKEETNIKVEFLSSETIMNEEVTYTLVTLKISVFSETAYARNLTLLFHHGCGSYCDVEVNFCFVYCPLTLHMYSVVTPEENPYPYYPMKSQSKLYDYMETSRNFLERWMFQQGFRRDLFPEIPNTFHAIASAMGSSPAAKSKGISISYLNFMRRIAGPLMKHIHKVTIHSIEEPLKTIKESHDTYRQIIHLLRSRGANLWLLQARFLLTYEEFVLVSKAEPPKFPADIDYTARLTNDKDLFNRLTTQCWFDLILQSYKVFIMDSCFFDCVCVTSQPRDIVKILVDWYNEQIVIGRHKLTGLDKTHKQIANITTDLRDGIAIISAIVNHCPFLEELFTITCDVDINDPLSGVINNACLIMEAMNILRLYFPLTSKDLLEPSFLQMLFLSVHLYVVLPMFRSKMTVEFSPPLLRSSTRHLMINPMSQESLMFNFIILGNDKNSFAVEKAPSGENGKKMYLNVKYSANYVSKLSSTLLIYGYNKTRIFDTYIVFNLIGNVGLLNPLRKCKLTAPLYRPNRVDVMIYSPFTASASYEVFLTDIEPTIPVEFEKPVNKRFYVRRLNLMESEIMLTGATKETSDVTEHKLYLQLYCLSSQVGNSWIWFRSNIGEFFIKVTTQPRSDFALDTLQVKMESWPLDPCSCGESCECYRTATLLIPHRNELMVKCLRYALQEHASDIMINIFDYLIVSTTGQIILAMLLAEGGTNISEVRHILRPENTYRISSRTLMPRMEKVTFKQHTDSVLALPITLPPYEKSEKFSITFTSECGLDIRTYKLLFIESKEDSTF